MSKYYTPSIEEFHIGFEYETEDFNDDEGGNEDFIWVKKVLDFEHNWLEIPNGYNEDKRVKYLDKEDIESFGFKFMKEYPGLEESLYELVKENEYKDNLDDWCLEYDSDCNRLRIFSYGTGDTTIFNGTIKNKSELSKLLKQLEIL